MLPRFCSLIPDCMGYIHIHTHNFTHLSCVGLFGMQAIYPDNLHNCHVDMQLLNECMCFAPAHSFSFQFRFLLAASNSIQTMFSIAGQIKSVTARLCSLFKYFSITTKTKQIWHVWTSLLIKLCPTIIASHLSSIFSRVCILHSCMDVSTNT